jgi:hypothetical protein
MFTNLAPEKLHTSRSFFEDTLAFVMLAKFESPTIRVGAESAGTDQSDFSLFFSDIQGRKFALDIGRVCQSRGSEGVAGLAAASGLCGVVFAPGDPDFALFVGGVTCEFGDVAGEFGNLRLDLGVACAGGGDDTTAEKVRFGALISGRVSLLAFAVLPLNSSQTLWNSAKDDSCNLDLKFRWAQSVAKRLALSKSETPSWQDRISLENSATCSLK